MSAMMANSSYNDHKEVQDAYERVLPDIAALTVEGRHGEALKLLDELLVSYEKIDKDGWLRRSVRSHRALLLLDMGRFKESLAEYDARRELGFHEPSEHIEYTLGRAGCLSGLKRYEESIKALEDGLEKLPDSHIGSALGLLHRLAEAYAAVGRPVPRRFASLLKTSAGKLGIGVPAIIDTEPERLGEAIQAVYDAATKQRE